MSAEIMSKTTQNKSPEASKNMRDEYQLDYSKAKSNRFAAHMKQPVVAVVLEADVASVFNSSKKVNTQLRSIIARRRSRTQSTAVTKRRRKAG